MTSSEDHDPAARGSTDVPVGTGLFAGPFSDDTVAEAVEHLAGAGIGVVPDEGGGPLVAPAAPESPLRLLHWQARNLALEAATGSGLLGADLDALSLPDPDHPGAPPASQALAAYVHGAETPGGELARQLIGDQDLAHADQVIYPTMVVTLFVSDLARAAQDLASTHDAGGDEIGAEDPIALRDVQLISATQAICPNFASFINEMVSDVVKILKLPRLQVPDSGIPILNQILQAGADLFVGFLNFAIDAAASVPCQLSRTVSGSDGA